MSSPSATGAPDYRAMTQGVTAQLGSFRAGVPEVSKGFAELGRAAMAGGVIDRKTKELIAVALSVAARCDPCIGYHVQAAVKLGATRQELDETLGVAVYMGGGPSLMYTAMAISAYDEFSNPPPPAGSVSA